MEGKNKTKYIFLYVPMTLVGVVFCLFMAPVFAASDDLTITEIMYDPEDTDTGNEWLEVFNRGTEELLLKGGAASSSWRFIDQFKDGLPQDGHKHTLSADVSLGPEEFLIISNNPANFLLNYPGYSGKIVKSSFSLLNESSSLALSSDGGKSWFSRIDYSSVQGASENGKTLEIKDFAGTDWQESFLKGGTPGKESSLPPPPPVKIEYPDGIVINELLPNPSGDEATDEFIEFFNSNSFPVDLSGWLIGDASKKSDSDYFRLSGSIGAEEYLVIRSSDYNFSLNNSGLEEVFLKNPTGEIVDQTSSSGTAKEDYSYARKNNDFFWSSTPTPGKENMLTEEAAKPPALPAPEQSPPTDPIVYPEKIYLNEILANPKEDEEAGEFIEIVNRENIATDLKNWMLRDASKTGKYIFVDSAPLEPDEYLVVPRSKSKLALNNSAETVSLFDPNEKLVSTISWEKAPENVSFNFDGTSWSWSQFLTPGMDNKFDEAPSVKIKIAKKVYKGTSAQFSVKAKDKETKHLKYIWDFGDGHKSYLKDTSHKYEKKGHYTASLLVRDASQEVSKYFDVQVESLPRPDLEMVKLVPNPSGKDSDKETISVKNNTSSDINLMSYKIATGTKNLSNHPIYQNLIIKAEKEKIITHQESKFVLANKAGKVQLIYPDGKIADKVKYQKEKIEVDEAYVKIDGKWQWILAKTNITNNTDQSVAEGIGQSAENTDQDGEVLGVFQEKSPAISGPDYQLMQDNNILILTSYFLPLDNIFSNSVSCTLNVSPSLFYPFVTSPGLSRPRTLYSSLF